MAYTDNHTDRRVVNQEQFHKWIGTVAVIVSIAWGALAYYVTAEDRQMELRLQSQLDVIKSEQIVDKRINEVVLTIDKQLSRIENSLGQQATLILEVRQLREEVNKLKLELAAKKAE